MAVLEVQDIWKSLGGRSVLKGVSFTIEKGEACAILGASGEGKTTLLKCLNLLVTIDHGEIILDGMRVIRADADRRSVSIEADPAMVRRRVGMVFQEWNLWPNLTIMENVALGPRYARAMSRKDAEARAAEVCERVRIGDKLDAYPHMLSGGQKQRAAIARALAVDPEVLMLDEVTSALDPVLAAEVLDVMTDLKADGRTLLVVTHHAGFARSVADKVVFLHEGRVHESGLANMLESPQTAELRWFLDRVRRVH